eukprot:264484_1
MSTSVSAKYDSWVKELQSGDVVDAYIDNRWQIVSIYYKTNSQCNVSFDCEEYWIPYDPNHLEQLHKYTPFHRQSRTKNMIYDCSYLNKKNIGEHCLKCKKFFCKYCLLIMVNKNNKSMYCEDCYDLKQRDIIQSLIVKSMAVTMDNNLMDIIISYCIGCLIKCYDSTSKCDYMICLKNPFGLIDKIDIDGNNIQIHNQNEAKINDALFNRSVSLNVFYEKYNTNKSDDMENILCDEDILFGMSMKYDDKKECGIFLCNKWLKMICPKHNKANEQKIWNQILQFGNQ